MFSLSASLQFQLYSSPTDMRKSFDGLCGIIQNLLGKDPANGDVFVFINKSKNKMKLLHWEYGGFVLYYKRLEEGTFELPSKTNTQSELAISWQELLFIIEGIRLKSVQKRKRFLGK